MNSTCQGVLRRSRVAKEMGREKRLGPALPGLMYRTPSWPVEFGFVSVAADDDVKAGRLWG